MTTNEFPLLLLITCCGFDLVRSTYTVCGVCQVDPLPLFKNKRVSVGVQWTKTVSSRAECAADCSHFHSIRSFGYKKSSGECVAYTEPLTTPEDTTYVGESGFNMYPTCVSVNHFGPCGTSADCTVAQTTCNEGLCVCNINHVYSHGSCVQGCSTYGSGFTSFSRKYIKAKNDRIIMNVDTAETCMSLCLAEEEFLCITADYAAEGMGCLLSRTAWYEVPPESHLDSLEFEILIRNCA